MMTLGELIQQLQDMVEAGVPEETPVKLATQPSYPFQYDVGNIVATELDDGQFVYIGEGLNQEYLPGAASEELGWK